MLDVLTIQETQDNIAKLSRELRKRNGLSRAELSEELGISASGLQKLEEGNNITMATFLLLLKHFNLKRDFDMLLNGFLAVEELPNFYEAR